MEAHDSLNAEPLGFDHLEQLPVARPVILARLALNSAPLQGQASIGHTPMPV